MQRDVPLAPADTTSADDVVSNEPRTLSPAQKLAWEHRRLNMVVAHVVELRHWFEGEELQAILTNVNLGLARIEANLKERKGRRVAKPWSKTP
jgi:predicted deacetylase